MCIRDRYEPEVINESAQPRDVLAGVTRVPHFDSVDPRGHELFDSFARSALRRMREDSQTTSAVDERDRVDDGEPFLPHVRGPPVAEITIECIAKVDRPSLGDHRPRPVRPADRAAGGLLEHRREPVSYTH